jgi:hypothetical protein
MSMQRLDSESLAQAMDAAEREQREDASLRRRLTQTQNRVHELEGMVDLLTAIDGAQSSPPKWSQPPKSKKEHHFGVANLMLSDLHLDEVVNLEEMGGRNKYDRDIATLRYKRLIDRTIRLARDYINGITYQGIVLWCGGDNISGEIHDELKRTNEGQHSLDTIEYWVDPLVAGIELLAEFFGHVRLVCVVGNHGRTTRKPEAKRSVRSNFDWSLYRQLHRATRADERISWNISEALGVKEKINNTTYWFEHGDAWKGGDQIAGPVRPIMFGRSRRLASEGQFDVMLACDKHTYATPPGIVMNGSLIGYSEYSRKNGFLYQPPLQAFWVDTPENGPGFHMPIACEDRTAEGW